jgi:hypothetical protein
VLRYDAALPERPGSFDGARHDRPPLVGDGNRSVEIASSEREGMIPKSGNRFSDKIMPQKRD